MDLLVINYYCYYSFVDLDSSFPSSSTHLDCGRLKRDKFGVDNSSSIQEPEQSGERGRELERQMSGM